AGNKTMKKLYIIIFTLLVSVAGESFSQLANQNTYLLAQLDQYGNNYSACWGYRAPNGREYAILGCGTGTSFVDITDSANIHEVDFLPGLSSSWREMKVVGKYAYIVSEASGSGLQIVNLKYLPDSINLAATYFYTGYTHTHSVSQSGPYIYLNGGNNTPGGSDVGGVTVIDVTNPIAPVKRGSWSSFYVHDCRIVNDTIYACNIYNPPGTVSVINAMNKDLLSTVSSWQNNPNPFPHNCALPMNDRRYIYTTDETSSPNGKLKVWNKQNLSNVTLVTSWQPTGITTAIVHNIETYNNIAVIAHYTAGIRILDISNPTSPMEIAWYDTYPTNNNANFAGCWGVFMFPSGKIIGSDISGGLFVIKSTLDLVGINNENVNIPSEFQLKKNSPNPFNPATTVEYGLPKASYVTVKVCDAVGREAALLVDEYKPAGNHKVNFDASRLATGVYFYSMSAGDFVQTKKMALVQ